MGLTSEKFFSIIRLGKAKEMIVIAKLDWTITSPEERLKCVEKVLEENPTPNEPYLELMGTYLTECMEKQEKKILTENRLATINKRETSLEGLIS